VFFRRSKRSPLNFAGLVSNYDGRAPSPDQLSSQYRAQNRNCKQNLKKKAEHQSLYTKKALDFLRSAIDPE
jgi:hypothetical protein